MTSPARRYRKRSGQTVTAVRVPASYDGFTYEKWGAEQRCKPGDWIVVNAGEFYTVDAEVFAATYREVGAGTYEKHAAVWARVADVAGVVATKEGRTHYEAGAYLVSNHEDGRDAWAVEADRFEAMYARDA